MSGLALAGPSRLTSWLVEVVSVLCDRVGPTLKRTRRHRSQQNNYRDKNDWCKSRWRALLGCLIRDLTQTRPWMSYWGQHKGGLTFHGSPAWSHGPDISQPIHWLGCGEGEQGIPLSGYQPSYPKTLVLWKTNSKMKSKSAMYKSNYNRWISLSETHKYKDNIK